MKAGDLLMFHIEDEGNTGHTAMAMSEKELIHADPMGGVCLSELDEVMTEGHPPLVFRAENSTVAGEAARLAKQWSADSRKTPFSSSLTMKTKGVLEARVFGVTEASKDDALLLFGYDALYRVFKWAKNGGDKPFSVNRGTTCCAFITACFQTARARTLIPSAAIQPILEVLTKCRNDKLPKEERIGVAYKTTGSGKELGRRPFPEFSNPGGQITFAAAWALVREISVKYGGRDLAHAHQLTTAAMFSDAKYAVTRKLLKRLRIDPVYWSEVKA